MPTVVRSRPHGVGGKRVREGQLDAQGAERKPEQQVVDAEESDETEGHPGPAGPDDRVEPAPQVLRQFLDAHLPTGPRPAPQVAQGIVEAAPDGGRNPFGGDRGDEQGQQPQTPRSTDDGTAHHRLGQLRGVGQQHSRADHGQGKPSQGRSRGR
jgi:hypothetical protein